MRLSQDSCRVAANAVSFGVSISESTTSSISVLSSMVLVHVGLGNCPGYTFPWWNSERLKQSGSQRSRMVPMACEHMLSNSASSVSYRSLDASPETN